jgi:hypothetical protein
MLWISNSGISPLCLQIYFCINSPSIERPVGQVLLATQADGAPEDLCANEAIWPRVLTPIDGALASDTDVVAPPVGKVRGDRARGRGATNLPCGTPGEVDPLSEGPARALPSAGSPSPSTGTETSLDAWEVDPPPMGFSRGRTSGRCARKVAVSYRDPASSSPLSSSSPKTISEGDSSIRRPSRLYWRRRLFNASRSRAFLT